MFNHQPPEKRSPRDGVTALDVHSIFYTIQGEGPFCGTPAVFIRLAGCNLQCPGCDTDYTSNREFLTLPTICARVALIGSLTPPNLFRGLVVITGGEPFRQNLDPLLRELVERGHYVQIETNGSLAPPDYFAFHHRTDLRRGAYIVCSPKAGKVHPRTESAACAFKYVMHADSVDPTDGLPVLALDHTAHPRVARPRSVFANRPIYLQPMDSQDPLQNARNRAVCVASCLKHGYILQLQVHKLLGME